MWKVQRTGIMRIPGDNVGQETTSRLAMLEEQCQTFHDMPGGSGNVCGVRASPP